MIPQPPRENLDTAPASDDRIIRMIGPKCIRLHHEDWMWAEIRCPDSAQQLVFDFSHESEMRLQDQKNLAAQFLYVMRTARLMRPYPFHLNLCGLLPGTNQYAFMEQAFGIETPGSSVKTLADIPWTISPNHYTVDFPLNDLSKPVIYLSPNAPRCFEPGEWDHTAVYVIGAVVDKSVRRPVTLAKARRAGKSLFFSTVFNTLRSTAVDVMVWTMYTYFQTLYLKNDTKRLKSFSVFHG
ncbi:hypothetical protein CRM22_002517 [Opisthorchis felineus]|uniref:SAM-dependent MTase TRM10-type domain-containing protein n=1 Tax=Opisthorchis felineus TaxID=147828 RepID=A0A4S2M5L9_OPIFE|nr:hypothetical protein CRM22_002517 [Opisthorchis felineus]TGZ71666.1 hypothetical protein CRM22_002517 [Opisthorchis felineus]TGZ71670.1 hypothetical protein CRM22_002517 [Opisthorchis felineus]